MGTPCSKRCMLWSGWFSTHFFSASNYKMQCQKQIHSLFMLQCCLSPGWGLCFSCIQFLIRILWFLLLQNRTLFNQVLMGGSTALRAEQWFESPGFYFQLHCWLAVHPALGRSKAEWMALHLMTFSVCTAWDGKQIRHLALSLEELWSLENRCVVTLCLLFKAKEQNKLPGGGGRGMSWQRMEERNQIT